MSRYSDPGDLYPDVAAVGGLAAALRSAAVGLSVVESDPLFGVRVPATVAHRESLEVSASRVERRWFVRGGERAQGLTLVEGDTLDLAGVAGVARAWQVGVALEELAVVAPFVRLTGRFEVPDGDPAGLVASEWRYLRREAVEAGWPEYRALIEAAFAEVRLRELYPFTSHWTLRFSTRTRPCLSDDVWVCVRALDGEGFVVMMGYLGPELGRVATAREAVALVVRHLPEGLPVVSRPTTTVRTEG